VDIISASREQTCIFVLCTKEKSEEVSEILRGVGFSHPNSGVDEAPSIKLISIKKQISECESSIIEAEKEIKSYEDKLDDLYFLQDYDTMRTEKYEVISHLLQTSKVFVMTGYIPEVETKNIIELLNERFEIAIELEQPDMDEEVPIMFKNNGFSNPLENTVEAFSPPGKGELDPTMVMSLFYYLLFGLMLSDAGYGALIAIGCGVLLVKFKNTLEISMRKTLKMYLFCGISTVFWGIMFGSYFGDIVDIVSESFFGQKITIPPLWFFPVNEPMRMLSFSLLLGLLHLLTGLGMKLYQCMKHKDYKSALYDVVLWFVLLISTVLLLLSMQMVVDILSIDFILPSAVGSISGIFAGLAAIGIVLTNGRESRNPFKRFLKGLYALYGITGYLSDVLSYSRLLALGLATGVIASVINKMAAMVTGGIIGAFFFILIVIGGHTLNIGINALGAYVHTNRLQYVEFFGKFYEGGGRMFNPFSARTKYYKFKEKIKNG
jgi:V/A-type H+-transporting ATPase subunit I